MSWRENYRSTIAKRSGVRLMGRNDTGRQAKIPRIYALGKENTIIHERYWRAAMKRMIGV